MTFAFERTRINAKTLKVSWTPTLNDQLRDSAGQVFYRQVGVYAGRILKEENSRRPTGRAVDFVINSFGSMTARGWQSVPPRSQ